MLRGGILLNKSLLDAIILIASASITTGFVLDCRIRSIAAADSKCYPSPGPIPTAE